MQHSKGHIRKHFASALCPIHNRLLSSCRATSVIASLGGHTSWQNSHSFRLSLLLSCCNVVPVVRASVRALSSSFRKARTLCCWSGIYSHLHLILIVKGRCKTPPLLPRPFLLHSFSLVRLQSLRSASMIAITRLPRPPSPRPCCCPTEEILRRF